MFKKTFFALSLLGFGLVSAEEACESTVCDVAVCIEAVEADMSTRFLTSEFYLLLKPEHKTEFEAFAKAFAEKLGKDLIHVALEDIIEAFQSFKSVDAIEII